MVEPTAKVRVSLTVNGEPADALVDGYKTLLEVLREDLRLTGTKHGCELGECGACAVLVDGEPVLSCLVLGARVRRRRRPTVEGLARDAPSCIRCRTAFADLGAAQCGYCTPGILMTAKALLDRKPASDARRDQEALSGNLCRCTGYLQIYRGGGGGAAKLARGGTRRTERRRRSEDGSIDVIGKPRRRVDGRAKVTGQTRFADDLVLPRMLHCKLLRSHACRTRASGDRHLERGGASRRAPGAHRQGLPDPLRHPAGQQDEHALVPRARALRRRSGRRGDRARRGDRRRGAAT